MARTSTTPAKLQTGQTAPRPQGSGASRPVLLPPDAACRAMQFPGRCAMIDTMRPSRAVAALCALVALGCGDPARIASVYRVPASLDELAGERFFDHPWPSDMRIEAGSPRLRGYPNPHLSKVIDGYIEAVQGKIDGFSPAGAGFLRFTGAIDPGSLPRTPIDAVQPDASVQLIDVDPSSPERGQRKLVSLHFRANRGIYYPENTLGFMPTPGFPLRPHT